MILVARALRTLGPEFQRVISGLSDGPAGQLVATIGHSPKFLHSSHPEGSFAINRMWDVLGEANYPKDVLSCRGA